MTDEVSGKRGGPGWLPFDLLGHPVPPNKGERGRDQHVPTAENLEKLVLLFGMGRTEVDCAAAIGVSVPTMRKHYFSSPELKRAKRHAGLLLEAELLQRLNQQSIDGKTSATEKLLKRLDKSRLGPTPIAAPKSKTRKGVKEERRDAAWDAGREDSGWGPLLHGPGSILPN